jgi:hypothetical protein
LLRKADSALSDATAPKGSMRAPRGGPPSAGRGITLECAAWASVMSAETGWVVCWIFLVPLRVT